MTPVAQGRDAALVPPFLAWARIFSAKRLGTESSAVADTIAEAPSFLMVWSFALVAALETLRGYITVPANGLIDPDSYMRVVRIREGLATGWFTHVVQNDNGGAGTIVYWSHLIDALVMVLYAPLRLVLDNDAALRWAAALTGPLFAGALGAALVWVVAPVALRRWLWTAPLVAVVSSVVGTLGVFGWIHHHLPLALTTLLCAGWAARAAIGSVEAGYWSGFWAAVGLWLSPEALPYDLMALGAIGVAWSIRPDAAGRPFAAAGTALLAVVALAVVVDPPAGGRLSAEIDCNSIVFVILAALLCGAGWLLDTLGRRLSTIGTRLAVGALVCGGAMAAWVALYPAVLHGLSGLMPEAAARAFFGDITEMQPIDDISSAILHLLTGTLSIVVALVLAWQKRSALWLYAAVCATVVLVLGVLYIRFAVYAQTLGAAAAPVAITLVAQRFPLAHFGHALRRVAMLALFALAPLGPVLAWVQPTPDPRSACIVEEIVPALAGLPGAVVLTGINETPELLWRTPVKTVGSLYHRSVDAFLRAREAWRTPPSTSVPEAVIATGATHVLACELKDARSKLVGELPSETLEDRLSRREVPGWLHEEARAGGYAVYRVSRAD